MCNRAYPSVSQRFNVSTRAAIERLAVEKIQKASLRHIVAKQGGAGAVVRKASNLGEENLQSVQTALKESNRSSDGASRRRTSRTAERAAVAVEAAAATEHATTQQQQKWVVVQEVVPLPNALQVELPSAFF